MSEGEYLDLAHLLPAAREVALLPAHERVMRIRSDRWIGYPKAMEALNKLEALLNWPSKQRMPNLLIIGPTNNGKSMIIEKLRRAHPAITHADGEYMPIVNVQMPPDPSIKRFYAALLAAMGCPIRPKQQIGELEQQSLKLLQAVKVKLLVIDELHNLTAGGGNSQREFLNLLRFLGNELRIPLVGVGTKEAYLAIRTDAQLENRFEPLVLPLWQEGADLESLLASFAAILPLRRPSLIANPDMARYLVTRTEGTIGELATLLTSTAIAAIASGDESITPHALNLANYDSPTERRRTFERVLL
ncbi:MAG: TniB family NTP-binding protein [Gammaproteobacteria bacterium]|nr:TniB family NTP-binding protein [Gammaproteobacteria bacterium]